VALDRISQIWGGGPVRIALWVIVAILNLIVINRQPVVYLAKLEQAVQSAVTNYKCNLGYLEYAVGERDTLWGCHIGQSLNSPASLLFSSISKK